MFKLFKRNKRVEIQGDNIFIDNSKKNIGTPIEIETVFKLTLPIPEIKVYENNQLVRLYRIESLKANPNLSGQFLHSSIRILENSAVMIDGIISKSNISFPKWTDENYEAVRLQPFYLSNANDNNLRLIGKGLFDRGLHFSGTVTPTTVRSICICDNCKQSFSLHHFHAGFSEGQYFYSSESKETLFVPYNSISNMPTQLQETVDLTSLLEVESKLPKSSDGHFLYYNSFKCPYCFTPFVDFEKHKEMRPKEYYGNTLLNETTKQWREYNGS